jgi:hypothetical protein
MRDSLVDEAQSFDVSPSALARGPVAELLEHAGEQGPCELSHKPGRPMGSDRL